MTRTAVTEKLFILGVDAMDPRLTQKYVKQGLMPNMKKLIAQGACRENLVLLGAMPTVTPPQWTTLATGAYPQTHDCTGFYRQGDDLDLLKLNFDSRDCKAEQLWNVTAEADKKTLVWHWPGSAWPPSSDNPNLHVVDGTSPGSVNMSSAQFESEYLVLGNVNNVRTAFMPAATTTAEVPCVVTGLGEDEEGVELSEQRNLQGSGTVTEGPGFQNYIMDPQVDGQGGVIDLALDAALTPIKDADDKWAYAPEGAKEFTLLISGGLIRRAGLILPNDNGQYDSIAIYKNKSQEEPMVVLKKGEYFRDYVDDAIRKGAPVKSNRDLYILDLAEDGTSFKMWVSAAMEMQLHAFWHPADLYQDITSHIGYPPPTSTVGGDKQLIGECMYGCWEHTMDWQGDCLAYLMQNKGYEVVFSHFHAPDLQKHMFIRNVKKGYKKITPADHEQFLENIYMQVDRYIGKFLPLLEQDWTIFVVSDHAQVCPSHGFRGIGETCTNVRLMEELGYTILKKDEKGEDTRQIDWSKTTAVANREMYIYLNLKGRTDHGIVDEADRYELEERIITDLYGYKDRVTGRRIIAFALRRKDAALLGMDIPYPQGGDIVYSMAEGYEHDHADSMSTAYGEANTSVSPIFVAAGKGIKPGYTKRVIRQVDVAPTAAVLLGVRMPNDAEGAPVYQIMAEQF